MIHSTRKVMRAKNTFVFLSSKKFTHEACYKGQVIVAHVTSNSRLVSDLVAVGLTELCGVQLIHLCACVICIPPIND